jgi:hypothetical protein
MARSQYIYLLVDTASGEAVGAFTVKHELVAARARHDRPTHAWRYRDNQPGTPVVDITEELP